MAEDPSGEYKQFLGMARGSNFEVQTQLVISKELGFGEREKFEKAESLSHKVGKMLVSMLNRL